MANIPISSFTAAANTTGIGMSGFSLTGSNAQSIVDLAGTWNTSGTPTGLKLDVTDTASNAASLLMDLRVGGVSKFSVTKGTATSTVIQLNSNGGIANIEALGNSLTLSGNGGHNVNLPAANFQRGGVGFGFVLGTAPVANSPIFYGGGQEANHTLAQRNGVNAQTSRVYNTYTDASNYERGFVRWATNVLEIGAESDGTGTARDVSLTAAAGSVRISGSASGGIAIGNVGPEGNNRLTLTPNVRIGGTFVGLNSNTVFGWGTSTWVHDTTLTRVAAGIVGVRDATTGGAAVSLVEQTAPAAPATNGVYIYAQDNGAGKTQLMARFATGAAVQIAIEP